MEDGPLLLRLLPAERLGPGAVLPQRGLHCQVLRHREGGRACRVHHPQFRGLRLSAQHHGHGHDGAGADVDHQPPVGGGPVRVREPVREPLREPPLQVLRPPLEHLRDGAVPRPREDRRGVDPAPRHWQVGEDDGAGPLHLVVAPRVDGPCLPPPREGVEALQRPAELRPRGVDGLHSGPGHRLRVPAGQVQEGRRAHPHPLRR
mmetsp:Transcript_128344/g.399467  ORF Transcript_128344/g.399467 Transcript_128344/m.399467 type:complete len:204 (-) Transcript_128344:162-773(-)